MLISIFVGDGKKLITAFNAGGVDVVIGRHARWFELHLDGPGDKHSFVLCHDNWYVSQQVNKEVTNRSLTSCVFPFREMMAELNRRLDGAGSVSCHKSKTRKEKVCLVIYEPPGNALRKLKNAHIPEAKNLGNKEKLGFQVRIKCCTCLCDDGCINQGSSYVFLIE